MPHRPFITSTLGVLCTLLLLCALASTVSADGPADNRSDTVRPIPPVGVAISIDDRHALEAALKDLANEIEATRERLATKPDLLAYLPDIQIFHKAVRYALDYNEFYKPKTEIPAAKRQITLARERAQALREGSVPWNRQTGLVVRAYRSKIDDSVQPYGLVIPDTLDLNSATPLRLDTWFHGRGEKLTELSFIDQRLSNPGQFTPPNTIVLHLYGRYCNANKFAGEVDLFEALEDVKKHYSIDENRILVRGFSMGGAACWQFATHFSGLWAGAAPGAGFSETPEFLRVFQKETLTPTWYEKKLWHWYDATSYALNLYNCPTVAYSGGIDRQKQAADIMALALEREGMELTHIIGPDTGHRYHPEAKAEINRLIDNIARQGRNPVPAKVKFVTYTLRYSKMLWIELQGLEEHWERAQVEAEITDATSIQISTKNVRALSINMPPGLCPLDNTLTPTVTIDGQALKPAGVFTDRSWNPHFRKSDDKWQIVSAPQGTQLEKSPGLQGPIDDAFLDSFLMVLPSGRALNDHVEAWSSKEQQHAVTHWRNHFRGTARIKLDTQVTSEDIERHHLIIWGDPQSNLVMKRIATQLPIQWNQEGIRTHDKIYPTDKFVPVMVYPNPLNPHRYVVLNSGFTFREYDHLNNARQVAKLPDWAIIDISHPVTPRHPGKITDAGFFDEQWQLKD